MSKQTINIGASPNDGTGTPLRTSFDYTNQNFTEIYTALGGGVALPGATTQVIFNDGGTNLAGDAGLVYNKTTDTLTAGNATITGAATVGTTLGVTGVSTFAAGTAALPALTTTGDTNTGIYYPAADTFAVTTGGTERYRVDSAGNFGIGNTPTTAWRSGARALQVGVSKYVSLHEQSNGSTNLAFSNYESAANVFSYTTGDAPSRYAQINGAHQWYSAAAGTANTVITFGNAKMTLNSVGNLTLDAGNLIMGTSGKGIDFSAVTGGTGTATANVLNDYEEGTWVGTLTGSTTNPTVAVTATGRYTKIGRVVTVQIFYSNVSTVGASGNISITGLPFANSTLQSVGAVSLYQIGTFTGSTFAIIDSSNSSIEFNSNISGSVYGNVTHNAGIARYLTTSITYTVA